MPGFIKPDSSCPDLFQDLFRVSTSFFVAAAQTWMAGTSPGTSPAMTASGSIIMKVGVTRPFGSMAYWQSSTSLHLMRGIVVTETVAPPIDHSTFLDAALM